MTRSLTIPDIINGSYKEGFEIEWEISRDEEDYDKIVLYIYRSTLPNHLAEAIDTYISREIERHRPEIKVQYV